MLVLFASTLLKKQLPVVAMHGIFSSADNMELMLDVLRKEVPGLYAVSCEVGNGFESSALMNIRKQVDELAKCIANDPNLKNGFIGIGHSQGGMLLRAYL